MKKIISLFLIITLLSLPSCTKTNDGDNADKINVTESELLDSKGEFSVKKADDVFWDEFDDIQGEYYEFTDDEVQMYRELTDTAIILKYENSVMSGEYYHNVYSDSEKKQYYYTEYDDLFRYSNLDGVNKLADKIALSDPEKILTQEESLAVVDDFVVDILKVSLEGYEIESVNRTESGACEFVYKKRGGKDNFITVGTFTASVNALGEIVDCGFSNPAMLKGFDDSAIADISRADIENAVADELKKTVDKLVEYKVESTSVIKYKNEYMIMVLSSVMSQNGKTMHRMMVELD